MSDEDERLRDEAEEELQLPPEFDQEALALASERFWEIVEDPKGVELMVTSEFREKVRGLIEDEAYAAAYEQDREHAFALAKTIERSDGSIHVVVYSDVFHVEHPFGSPVGTLEHEALHVAITQRGESLNDLRIRHVEEELPTPADIVAMAGVAAEEYRVERILAAADHKGRPRLSATFQDSARRIYSQLAEDVESYQSHLDVRRLAEGVLGGFHALVTECGYLAGELAATNTTPQEMAFAEDVEELMLGPAWREVITALLELPAADQPTSRAALDAAALLVAQRIEDWLTHIGFELTESGEQIHFQVRNPAQWIIGPRL
jgi:hypothetical protein